MRKFMPFFIIFFLAATDALATSIDWRVSRITFDDQDDYKPKIFNNYIIWDTFEVLEGQEERYRYLYTNLYDGHIIKRYDAGSIDELQKQPVYDYLKSSSYPDRIKSHPLGRRENWFFDTAGKYSVLSERTDFPQAMKLGGAGVYFSDGIRTLNLSDERRTVPRVNANGQVVWIEQSEIRLWDNSSAKVITIAGGPGTGIHAYSTPNINNSGHLVWQLVGNERNKLFFYNGSSIIEILDCFDNRSYGGDYENFSPQISDDDIIVWGKDGKIYSYYNGVIQEVSNNNQFYNFTPEISGRTITWYAAGSDEWANGTGEIFKAVIVPEPASLFLFGLGAAAFVLFKKKEKLYKIGP